MTPLRAGGMAGQHGNAFHKVCDVKKAFVFVARERNGILFSLEPVNGLMGIKTLFQADVTWFHV